MKLKIVNETQYDGRAVSSIVRWVLKQLDLNGEGVVVKVKHHTGAYSYSGRCYINAHAHRGYILGDYWDGWKEVGPKIPRGYNHLLVCRVGKPGTYPCGTHVYDRRDSPGTWRVEDWREALVSVTAHEAMHLRQYKIKSRKRGRFNEVETEWAAFRLCNRWKEERR
jgi:hypothetical protein